MPRPAREGGRSAKAQSHKADAQALEESDRTILSMNQTNQEEQSSAEPGEKRVRAKENIVSCNTRPTQRGAIECARAGAVYAEPPSSSRIPGGSRMRENRSYGSVRGAISDGRPHPNTWSGTCDHLEYCTPKASEGLRLEVDGCPSKFNILTAPLPAPQASGEFHSKISGVRLVRIEFSRIPNHLGNPPFWRYCDRFRDFVLSSETSPSGTLQLDCVRKRHASSNSTWWVRSV